MALCLHDILVVLCTRFQLSALLPALLALGCGSEADNGVPDPDAAVGADGGGGAGLIVEIEVEPERGSFDADFSPILDDVVIELSDFRAIRDSAPGDDRTRLSTLTLTFSESGERTFRFDNAPVGANSGR